jgi:hypothetical protein
MSYLKFHPATPRAPYVATAPLKLHVVFEKLQYANKEALLLETNAASDAFNESATRFIASHEFRTLTAAVQTHLRRATADLLALEMARIHRLATIVDASNARIDAQIKHLREAVPAGDITTFEMSRQSAIIKRLRNRLSAARPLLNELNTLVRDDSSFTVIVHDCVATLNETNASALRNVLEILHDVQKRMMGMVDEFLAKLLVFEGRWDALVAAALPYDALEAQPIPTAQAPPRARISSGSDDGS